MRTPEFLRTAFAFLVVMVHGAAAATAAEPQTLKVFILAGQSNMEGQGVVDLDGKDYNGGKGTLAALMRDPEKKARYAHLKDDRGEWRVRDDVWARYQREDGAIHAGPLTFGFTPYGDQHHFGPELQFGHVVGEALEQPVLLIKTAWGGKSLYADFRPPSSGGEVGPYYTLMIEQVRETLANIRRDFPEVPADRYEIAGFVWYQGWNDGCDPKHAVPEYESNLVNLIKDVRKDLGTPNLPVVVGELTGPWVNAPAEWEQLRAAQASAAAHPEFAGNVLFVPTREFVRAPEDSPNPGHGHHEFGNAETYFLVGDALGAGMLKLLRGGVAAPQSHEIAAVPRVPPKEGEMAGYLLVSTERVPAEFNAGFSIYAAAW
ncbi:MAG: sialate O-acetylesterase, partial [Phycisphaerales bacterium]